MSFPNFGAPSTTPGGAIVPQTIVPRTSLALLPPGEGTFEIYWNPPEDLPAVLRKILFDIYGRVDAIPSTTRIIALRYEGELNNEESVASFSIFDDLVAKGLLNPSLVTSTAIPILMIQVTGQNESDAEGLYMRVPYDGGSAYFSHFFTSSTFNFSNTSSRVEGEPTVYFPSIYSNNLNITLNLEDSLGEGEKYITYVVTFYLALPSTAPVVSIGAEEEEGE